MLGSRSVGSYYPNCPVGNNINLKHGSKIKFRKHITLYIKYCKLPYCIVFLCCWQICKGSILLYSMLWSLGQWHLAIWKPDTGYLVGYRLAILCQNYLHWWRPFVKQVFLGIWLPFMMRFYRFSSLMTKGKTKILFPTESEIKSGICVTPWVFNGQI